MRIHAVEKSHSCSECNEVFTTLFKLKKHKIDHNEKLLNIFQVCYKEFASVSYLKDHMTVHNTEKTLICSECPKTFTVSRFLKRHENSQGK